MLGFGFVALAEVSQTLGGRACSATSLGYQLGLGASDRGGLRRLNETEKGIPGVRYMCSIVDKGCIVRYCLLQCLMGRFSIEGPTYTLEATPKKRDSSYENKWGNE